MTLTKPLIRNLASPLILATMITSTLSACSSEQVYASGQAWQRNECSRQIEKSAYDNCMSRSNTSYDTYKKETQDINSK